MGDMTALQAKQKMVERGGYRKAGQFVGNEKRCVIISGTQDEKYTKDQRVHGDL